MIRNLPLKPDIEHDKKEAIALLQSFTDFDDKAIKRLKESHPKYTDISDDEIKSAEFKLSDAQLTMAREYGFESWAKLTHQIDYMSTDFGGKVESFIDASIKGDMEKARELLEREPDIGTANIVTASILGNPEHVRKLAKENCGITSEKTGHRNWEPILYMSFSRFHVEDPEIADGILKTAKFLLENGADENTFYYDPGWPDSPLRPLWAATCESVNVPLARILLEAGAMVNDAESIYHAPQYNHVESMELLLEYGVDLSGPFMPWNNTPLYFLLGYKESDADSRKSNEGIRWLLEHGADPNVPSYDHEEVPLQKVAWNLRNAELAEMLIEHGAEVNKRRKDGKTPYAMAVRSGNTAVADVLFKHGAREELSDEDEILGACMSADSGKVKLILGTNPGLINKLSDDDLKALSHAAMHNKTEQLKVMLDAGWPSGAVGDFGATALHFSCFNGDLESVETILKYDPPLTAKDTEYDGSPIGWAIHASMNMPQQNANYPGVIEAMINAGVDPPDPKYAEGHEVIYEVLKKFYDGNDDKQAGT